MFDLINLINFHLFSQTFVLMRFILKALSGNAVRHDVLLTLLLWKQGAELVRAIRLPVSRWSGVPPGPGLCSLSAGDICSVGRLRTKPDLNPDPNLTSSLVPVLVRAGPAASPLAGFLPQTHAGSSADFTGLFFRHDDDMRNRAWTVRGPGQSQDQL